ncbi:MAG: hypothetical protein JXJ04_15205 [Spirochaetales bacterium]|nr:hypothetical protein [Spirochaetales bacterium]
MNKEGKPKKVINIKTTIDDRIAGGIYTGPSLNLFKNLIENPEFLLKPPELSHAQLDSLMLKKYKHERILREKQKKKR